MVEVYFGDYCESGEVCDISYSYSCEDANQADDWDYDDDCDDDYPCDDCGNDCDGWEAQFCCRLCHYNGGGDCDSCDSMDI